MNGWSTVNLLAQWIVSAQYTLDTHTHTHTNTFTVYKIHSSHMLNMLRNLVLAFVVLVVMVMAAFGFCMWLLLSLLFACAFHSQVLFHSNCSIRRLPSCKHQWFGQSLSLSVSLYIVRLPAICEAMLLVYIHISIYICAYKFINSSKSSCITVSV